MVVVVLLIFSPFIFMFAVPYLKSNLKNIAIICFVGFLACLSLLAYFLNESIYFNFSHSIHYIFIILDIILLFYFLWQGIVLKNKLVLLFSIAQIILYAFVLSMQSSFHSHDVVTDKLSLIMYLVINIVGGVIIIYALTYIDSEPFSQFKKDTFLSTCIFFLGVMNFIVSVNNIEIFFLLFELTTLCSYLLIRYRGDEVSTTNALRALWMNQIGGIFILCALIGSLVYLKSVDFSYIISQANGLLLLIIIFLVFAAYVKGASFPFQNWLLGAMVAPTPVSAMLHSATMVKIAPFLILKLAPSFSPALASCISIFGSFVFLVASIMALNKDFFKEVLGLSTIAILGLIMALAAIGTKEATDAALLLVVFHAISKALLFLSAGVLEKLYHLKYISEINSFINKAPKFLFIILISFSSLCLPPFGVFIGKFMAFEALAKTLHTTPLNVIVIIFLALGSAILTFLYFKIASNLLAKEPLQYTHNEKYDKGYFFPLYILLALLFGGIGYIFYMSVLSSLEIFVPLVLLVAMPFVLFFLKNKKQTFVKEYNCGEKDEVVVTNYVLNITDKEEKIIKYSAIFIICCTLIVGATL